MRKAKLEECTNKKGFTFHRLIRGKLNEEDKHWGMRSSLNFRKRLEVAK